MFRSTQSSQAGADLTAPAISGGSLKMGRPTCLAACLIAGLHLGCASMPATAMTRVVTRCDDPVPGHLVKGYSLRIAVSASSDGDIVDLAGLTCGTITLTQGQVPVTVDNLTIQAPGSQIVDGSNAGRVIEHTGTGLLDLFGLDIRNGNGYGNVGSGADGLGGCVRSAGSVLLQYSSVSACAAVSGGGVHTIGNLSLVHATIADNSIHYHVGLKTIGGGVFTKASLLASYSTISGNYSQVYTGGAYSAGAMTVSHSVVSGNSANFSTGVFDQSNDPNAYPRCTALAAFSTASVIASTVESNHAAQAAAKAGAYKTAVCSLNSLSIESSTLSANSGYALSAIFGSSSVVDSTISANAGAILFRGAGASLNVFSSTLAFNGTGVSVRCSLALGESCSLWVESSIMTDSQPDFPGNAQLPKLSNNLVAASPALAGLAPLAYHGGPTRTHALVSGSPAVNAGSNPGAESYDQRGINYTRTAGPGPDIGAYERQLDDDELFYSGCD